MGRGRLQDLISRYLGEDLTIIVLANLAQSDPERFVGRHRRHPCAAARAAGLKRFPTPSPRSGTARRIAASGQGRPALAGRISYLRAGSFPTAKAYQERLTKLGAIQRVSLVERKELGDDRVYRYEIGSATESLIVTLGLAADGKVSLFSIRSKEPPLVG